MPKNYINLYIFFILNKSMSYAKGMEIDKLEGSIIDKIVNEIIRTKDSSLANIKKVIKEAEGAPNLKKSTNAAKVIETILQTKVSGDKIILRDGIFSKPINDYLCYSGISCKCLTNDQLFLRMIAKKIIELQNYEDGIQTTFDSPIAEVIVTSQNYSWDLASVTGLIQDWDPTFSAICSQGFRSSVQEVKEIIARKPNGGTFEWGDYKFQFFGNENIAIICQTNLGDDEILEKLNDQQYFRTDNNTFKKGEKLIKSGKGVTFMYQDLVPEDFCPAYWVVPTEVKCSFLFKFEYDYNELYKLAYDPNKDTFSFPTNMFYWDTMNQAFDFIAVLGLTSPDMSDEKRKSITKIVKDFFYNKDVLIAMKSTYMKIQRIFHDFLNGFLNNSGYERFSFLNVKVEKVIGDLEDLKKKNGYVEAVAFINNLPFCHMIKNQLKDNRVVQVIGELNTTLKKYLKGTNPASIVGDIRQCASRIISLLPTNDVNEACFPFIVAQGPLFGDLIQVNDKESDVILKKVDAQIAKKEKEKKKKRDTVKKTVEVIISTEEKLDKYFKKYQEARPTKGVPQIAPIDYREVTRLLKAYLTNLPATSPEFIKEITIATDTENDKKIKYKKDPLIELFIKDYLTAISQPKGKGKKKKVKIVSKKFLDTANMTGTSFDVEAEEESSDDEDVKMETKEDTTTPQPKRSITTRSKAKKDDMDVDDE